jgi:hypothetical protein
LLWLLSSELLAQGRCFSLAESYYEQIYCELKFKGLGQSLPSWRDFKRNNEQMQALLLKAPAGRVGIEVAMPKKSRKPKPLVSQPELGLTASLAGRCQLTGLFIECGAQRYQWQRNQSRSQLPITALTDANRMALPVFSGGALATYLLAAYEHYLQKMLAIGLAETVLSYGKFEYLYHDLAAKGVNFNQRFETMYHYLKRERQQMSVPKAAQLPQQLTLADCYPLNRLWVCSAAGSQWVFSRQ